MEQIARWARPWRTRRRGRIDKTLLAAARCADSGWLAALDDGRLVASVNGRPPATDDDVVARGVHLCNGPPRPVELDEAVTAVAQCEGWIGAELLARRCGHVRASRTPERMLDRRVALAVERTPRHLRASAAARASQLIGTASVPRPLGAERALQRLFDDARGDADPRWLDQAAEVAAASVRGQSRRDGIPRIVALIALGPGRSH
jgi:hypothetical protein